ncbi:MAG TPA: DUF1648 domain-containing protein [Steroidobacteraceae bacterium]|nr:DUF1648 domain-containing protein [Steroidobacteraceae bacterium]
MRKFPLVSIALLLAAASLVVFSLAQGLPERVAVHYDAAGDANGYMTRKAFRTFMLMYTLCMPLFVVLVAGLLPRLLPTSMVNIPNRSYWLAPERAKDSLAFLSEQWIWFGCILLVFLTSTDWMIVKANGSSPPHLATAEFLRLLVLFLIALGGWTVRMFRRFRVPR